MLERDERESAGGEGRAEGKTPEVGVGEGATGPRLFSELETGVATRELEPPVMAETEEGGVEAEEGTAPAPPILTGRRKGGPFRRVVAAEPQAGVEGVTLSGEQRLLVLDAWARAERAGGGVGGRA